MKAVFFIVCMLGVSTLSAASPKPTDDTTRRTVVSGRITLLTTGFPDGYRVDRLWLEVECRDHLFFLNYLQH